MATISPLISVIIPCYNHGAYLAKALASIWLQDYPAFEVVLVDDGSTDMTKTVAQDHPWIKYVYQKNQGLPTARNTGVKHSCGQYLVFLDADDWLLPDALKTNAQVLQSNPNMAFVSGGHHKVFVAEGRIEECTQEVTRNHYENLLYGNYIGMPAVVMFHRWVFNYFTYDATLKAAEDYDLYLRVARLHSVAHHTHLVAAYRIHGSNMSSNIPLMLKTTLGVLTRQRKYLRNDLERLTYRKGMKNWKDYYFNALLQKVSHSPRKVTFVEISTLVFYIPKLVTLRFFSSQIGLLKTLFKNWF